MKKPNFSGMVTYCNDLTATGASLSVSWSGGHDDAWFEMKLDDKPIEQESDLNEAIMDLVADALGYGSFAGDFSTDGKVFYTRETQCFEGTDTYSISESGNQACTIPVHVSKDIWFDQLAIRIRVSDDNLDISPRFVIINGPRIDAHDVAENQLKKPLKKAIAKVASGIWNFSDIWNTITINHDDFVTQGNEQVFTIREISYNFYACDEKDITVSLTDKIDQDETI